MPTVTSKLFHNIHVLIQILWWRCFCNYTANVRRISRDDD